MNQSTYRPDIDGLRAVAVLSVLAYHLRASILPGGYVGVDIFFVISGYLITAQVHKEACDGRFSIKQFYKRRINRIVPALAAVITATLLIGTALLSPSDLVKLSKSAMFAMVGASNIFFWREYGNYFSGTSGEAPLLHTWSLGIEEQFYVVWPLFILLLLKLGRRYVAGALAILTVGAIAVSQVAVGIVASASYYLLPTRFFELMIGGLLALAIAHKRRESRYYAGLCTIAGAALICGSLFWLDDSSSFPGINALWPCLGAALLIWAGSAPHPSSGMLTNRPMVFIGLISYSLYLWHWPILAYLKYRNIAIGPFVALSVAFASILLAWLSWKFIEVPMRRSGAILPFFHVFLRRFAIPLAVLFSLGVVITLMKGFPQRFDSRVAALESVIDAKPEVLRQGCHVPTAMYETPPNMRCRLGVDKPGLDGILIGDSFANHFTGMMDVMAKAKGISLMDYTMDGCPPILGYETGNGPAYSVRCRKRNRAVYALVSASHFSRVVLAAGWPRTAEAGEQLISSIDVVLSAGSKLDLIIGNESIERASSCPIRRLMYGTAESCNGPRRGPPGYFAAIQKRYPEVNIIDPNQVICSGDVCSPIKDGIPLYRDDNHLNDIGSRLIGQSLLRMGIAL